MSQFPSYPTPEVYYFSEHTLVDPSERDRTANSEDEAAIERLRQALSGRQVLSLDVFDTLFVRNSKPEAVRYWEWSQEVAKQLSANPDEQDALAMEICFARAEGLELSYRTRPRRNGCGEGSIREVHRHVCGVVTQANQSEEILLETELRLEAENLKLNPTFLVSIRNFTDQGGNVILVSDMYLHSEDISWLVNKLLTDDAKLISKIYSSADHIYSKRSGRIFQEIADDLDLPADAFLHVGDSFEGDVYQARKAGWTALHYPVSSSELVERTGGLKKFIEAMHLKGLDVTRWAKL